jgi:hypothetical protein
VSGYSTGRPRRHRVSLLTRTIPVLQRSPCPPLWPYMQKRLPPVGATLSPCPALPAPSNASDADSALGAWCPRSNQDFSSAPILCTRKENPFLGVFSTLPSSRNAPLWLGDRRTSRRRSGRSSPARGHSRPRSGGTTKACPLGGGLWRHSRSPAARAEVLGGRTLPSRLALPQVL